ncbi:MAG: hypothetical protein RMJ83_05165 [Armatimonadota bacterium]|nr:hypothetical protein [Armatimonadota bacterium]
MLRRELLGIPLGIWLLSVLYGLLCLTLRAYYIDYEGLRQIAAIAEGFSRASTTWWSGHSALGVVLLWLLTLPLRFLPLVTAAQIVGTLSIWASGLILYRILRLVGLSTGLTGWLTFLFYGANVAWVSAMMLPVAALSMVLTAWWALSAIRWLAQRAPNLAGGTRLGVLGGVLGLVNLFALIPVFAAGILALRREAGARLLSAAVAVALVGYLVVYFVILPAQVQVGGVVRPKPSLIEWLWTGEGVSAIDIPRYSALYWKATGEQLQNAVLALGRPFRVRDVYQYYLGGTFITLLKGAFLLLAIALVVVLILIRTRGERVAVDRLVQVTRALGGVALLASLVVLVLWQGDRQAFYLGTLFWLIVGLGGWLGSYVEEDIRRLSYVLPALVVVMMIVGTLKAATLRTPQHDGERQEAEAFATGIREGDTLVAATRLAEWLRYYAQGKARVVDAACWLQPEAEFQTLLQQAQQGRGRLVVWDYALSPEVYRRAQLVHNPAWLESLGRAEQQARQAKGAYLRHYINLVVYPTLMLHSGEAQVFGAKQ